MQTLSLSTSASSMKCVVSTITLLALFALITSQVRRRAYGSIPIKDSVKAKSAFKLASR